MCEEIKLLKKFKFLYKNKTTATAKRFVKNRLKKRKYFLYNSIKISGNFDIKHL